MTQRSFTLPALLALALAACQQPANDTDIAIDNNVNAAEAANADIDTLPPSDESGAPVSFNDDAAATNVAEAPVGNATIPAQYRGRWGINVADCDPSRSDNKGLITIAEKTIRFYEATATLKEQRPAIATAFSGNFGFTGEGQTWERVETLTRTGDRLERRSTAPRGEVSDPPLTYRRCA